MVKGGDNSIPEYGSEASTSQHDQAEAALKGFLAAKASGNWAKACSYVAAATKKSIEELAAHAKQLKATGCASVLKTLSAGVPKSAGQEEEVTSGVASVRVKGNQAFALPRSPQDRLLHGDDHRRRQVQGQLLGAGRLPLASWPGAADRPLGVFGVRALPPQRRPPARGNRDRGGRSSASPLPSGRVLALVQILIYRALYDLVLQRLDARANPRSHRRGDAPARQNSGISGPPEWLLRPRGRGLETRVWGLHFPSPVGVAAGVDKSATWFEPLAALGFGFVEVGTATAKAQPGNEIRPRISRLPKDRALLNAMGFPNEGAARIAARLAARRGPGVIGANVGKTKVVALADAVADYRDAVRALAPSADYITLNVSSPNTPGLRQMQTVEQLGSLIGGVREELSACGRQGLPLLIKLSPDLPDAEIAQIAEMAVRLELGGIVAVNTTVDMGVAPQSAAEIAAQGHGGGISGRPLQARSLEVLRLLRDRTAGAVPLVSVGGVETAADAWERILAGACLVQVYTAFVYQGPLWVRRLNRDLARLLNDSAWPSIAAAVGQGAPTPAREGSHP